MRCRSRDHHLGDNARDLDGRDTGRLAVDDLWDLRRGGCSSTSAEKTQERQSEKEATHHCSQVTRQLITRRNDAYVKLLHFNIVRAALAFVGRCDG